MELRCGCIVRLALGARFWFVKVVPGFAQAILSAAVFRGPPWLEIGLSVDVFGLRNILGKDLEFLYRRRGQTLDDGKNPVMLYRLGAYGDTESPDSCQAGVALAPLPLARIGGSGFLLAAYFSDSPNTRTSASFGFVAMLPFSVMPPMVMMLISSQFRYAFMALYAAMAAS